MTVRRTLAVLTVALAAAFAAGAAALAPPAAAGGPTSVLVVSPGTGRATALYGSDPRYALLESLVTATDGQGTPTDAEVVSASGVTLTWMIHDVEPWRVDRIEVDGGTARITTRSDLAGTGDLWSSPAVVHDADRPAELEGLLRDLGVLGGGQPGAAAAEPSAAPSTAAEPVAVQDVPAGPAPATATADDTLLPAAAGAAAGLLAGAGGVLLVTRRRGRRPAAPPAPDGGPAQGPDADLDADHDREDVVAGYPGRV